MRETARVALVSTAVAAAVASLPLVLAVVGRPVVCGPGMRIPCGPSAGERGRSCARN